MPEYTISGTEIGKVLGVDERQGPLELYCLKRGLMESKAGDESAIWGTKLQRIVADVYAEREKSALLWLGDQPFKNKKFPYQTGHPDALAGRKGFAEKQNHDRVVEVKCRAFRKGWGEAGSDEVPLSVLAQAHWYMDLMEKELADVAVLFGGYTLEIYRLQYNAMTAARMRDAAERFITDHLVAGVAPAPQPTREAARALACLYKDPDKEILTPDPGQQRALEHFLTLKENAERASKDAEAASLAVKALIGNNLGFKTTDWSVTWPSSKGRSKTDWAAVSTEAAIPAEIVAKHTSQGEPIRRLLARRFDKKEDPDA